jgi:hypothetical protein
VIKKPRKNEQAKARYWAVENTTTVGCNARKTNKKLASVVEMYVILAYW